ncbi:MAG: hypothetical protein GEU73_10495 [Chloroflexi bacterium]|nr:hypothetical protein [Chloroflexota bacterium]
MRALRHPGRVKHGLVVHVAVVAVFAIVAVVLGPAQGADAFGAWRASTPPSAAEASSDRTVVLGPGEHVVLPDGTRLTFSRVASDSRCPIDVVCVWAGEVVVAFEVQNADGAVRGFEITFAGRPATEIIEGTVVTVLNVQPYPKTTRPIDPDDYRVTVAVEVVVEEERVITAADFGGTVELDVGQMVVVDPGGDAIWRAQVDDPSILDPLPTIMIFPPVPPRFRAIAPGKTTLRIIQSHPCRYASPPCLVPDRAYTVRIIVRSTG